MYSIASIKPAGVDWWHVVLTGPLDIDIPMRRYRTGATEEDIREMAQAWCDRQEEVYGGLSIARGGPSV